MKYENMTKEQLIRELRMSNIIFGVAVAISVANTLCTYYVNNNLWSTVVGYMNIGE